MQRPGTTIDLQMQSRGKNYILDVIVSFIVEVGEFESTRRMAWKFRKIIQSHDESEKFERLRIYRLYALTFSLRRVWPRNPSRRTRRRAKNKTETASTV